MSTKKAVKKNGKIVRYTMTCGKTQYNYNKKGRLTSKTIRY